MKYIALIFFIFVGTKKTCSQSISFKDEYVFTNHLITLGNYSDAMVTLSDVDVNSLNTSQQDSLFYLQGIIEYSLANTTQAPLYFSKISSSHPLFIQAKYFETFCYVYNEQFANAEKSLKQIDPLIDTDLKKFSTLCRASMALLQKDFVTFDSLSSTFTYSYFEIATQEAKLKEYAAELKKNRRKKMFLGSLYSALLPGSGKYYAGYKGQSMGTFAPVVLLAITAGENLWRHGYNHPIFWATGGMFAIFYTGNIWGGAFSVKHYREERQLEIKDNILLGIYIPLRHIFQ